MFDIDLLIALSFMALLFLRHVAILKKPNKINYAPLMIAIGSIASLIHFMIHPDPSNFILLLRESLMPLLVSIILYIVMNILNQTKESENAKLHDQFTRIMVQEITQLKEFILELESRMTAYSQEDRAVQNEIREKFKNDIKALDTIQNNQIEFTKKFDKMQEWHQNVEKAFAYFSEVQMVDLNEKLNKHIEMLRIAEQDHYNKLKVILQKAGESRFDMAEDIEDLKSSLKEMKNLSESVSKAIVEKTTSKLSTYSREFEAQILSLKLHAEGIKTTLYEDENILGNIRTQSEMIMNQIRLSAKQMDEFEKRNSQFTGLYETLEELFSEMQKIKDDYVKAQAHLTQLASEMEVAKEQDYSEIKESVEKLLQKLEQQHKINSENIAESVKLMAKKAQLQKGYAQLDD
jgi:predicted  nucleic acid-binding Zn-ribbon protein